MKRDRITPDAIVLGLGNGTSALGYIEEIRSQFGEAVAFFGFEGKYAPGVYKKLHGHPLTEGDEGRLFIYGCDGSEDLEFPRIDELIQRGILTKENHFLVSREECTEWFERENTGRNWRDVEGRSSIAARIVTRRELLRRGFRNVVCVHYDGACYGSNVPVTQESVYKGNGFYDPQGAHFAWLLSNQRIAEICSPKR
jgi:hypothetical protein